MAAWTDTGSRSRQVVQGLTDVPGDSSEGVNLDRVDAIVPVFHAPGGQTFTGAGKMVGYVWTGTLWVRSQDADIDMARAAGATDCAGPTLIVDSPRGKFQLVPSGVTLSGGTQITTEYFCTTKSLIGVAV